MAYVYELLTTEIALQRKVTKTKFLRTGIRAFSCGMGMEFTILGYSGPGLREEVLKVSSVWASDLYPETKFVDNPRTTPGLARREAAQLGW